MGMAARLHGLLRRRHGALRPPDRRPLLRRRDAHRDDQDVIALAAIFLQAAAAFQVFDAVQVVGGLSLRGLKDARWPMILAGGSYWLVGAPTCFFLAFGLHLRGLGVWIGFVIALAAAALTLTARFWRLTRPAAVAAA